MKKNSDLIQREVAFGFLSLTNQKQVKRRTHPTKYISIGVVSIDFRDLLRREEDGRNFSLPLLFQFSTK